MREGEEPRERFDADEVRSRAATGAALLGARGAVIYALGIAANLVLARLLAPRDFGIVAIGTVLVVLGGYVADGGLGAALIQRREPPLRIELESVYGFQILLITVFAALIAAGAAAFGREGLVVTVMVASLPIAVLRLPSMVLLERNLHYRVVATADVLEALCYYLWAVGAVALGLGVWGLATAVLVRATVGSAAITMLGPLGPVRPRLSWTHVRPLVGYGLKYQATGLLQVGREQVLNVGVAAVAGLATLGVWNLAWRVLQIPVMLFITVNRVAFPSMSRLLAAGEDPRPVIERGLAVLAALTGVVTVPLVALAPSLPGLVGSEWAGVPPILFWSGIGLVLSAPITVATGGYLFAASGAGLVARATIASAAVWLGVALPLLPALGAPAVGIGWLASGLVYAGMLWRATVARTGAAIAERLVVPTTIALVGTVAAWVAAEQAPDSRLGGIVGLCLGEAVLLGGLALLSRPALTDTRRLVMLSLGGLSIWRRAAETEPKP